MYVKKIECMAFVVKWKQNPFKIPCLTLEVVITYLLFESVVRLGIVLHFIVFENCTKVVIDFRYYYMKLSDRKMEKYLMIITVLKTVMDVCFLIFLNWFLQKI